MKDKIVQICTMPGVRAKYDSLWRKEPLLYGITVSGELYRLEQGNWEFITISPYQGREK